VAKSQGTGHKQAGLLRSFENRYPSPLSRWFSQGLPANLNKPANIWRLYCRHPRGNAMPKRSSSPDSPDDRAVLLKLSPDERERLLKL
jgi:hypothetical protein